VLIVAESVEIGRLSARVIDRKMDGPPMKKISVSKFKAKYLDSIKWLRKMNQPILVTRFGQPILEIRAVPAKPTRKRRLGTLSNAINFVGDIDAQVSSIEDWEAARDEEKPEPHKKKTDE
jgi:hypothetical protein